MKGEAIGVTTSSLRSFVTNRGLDVSQNVNYAVKSAYVSVLLSSLQENKNFPIVEPSNGKLVYLIPRVQDSIVQIIVKSTK